MCARIPISLDTCKGLCPLFHHTKTHSHILTQLVFTITHKHTRRPTFTHSSTHCLTQRDTNALETNYQSGVSSYIYLGQRGVNKRFYSSILPSVCLFSSFSLFTSVSSFSSLSLPLSHCLPPSLPDIAEARGLQVVFSVRSNEKLPETRG